MRSDDQHNPLAIEIRQEAAATYFAACKKMVASLSALKTFDDSIPSSTLDEHQIKRRSQLLEVAAERVHFVLIQREAMNLPWYEHFFEDYGVPPEIVARLGRPPRRK